MSFSRPTLILPPEIEPLCVREHIKQVHGVEIGHRLGTGSTATVYEGTRHKTGDKYAIKIFPRQNQHIAFFENSILHKLRFIDSVPRTYNIYVNDDFVYLVLDLCPGKELFEIIAESSVKSLDGKTVVKQILTILAHMHANGIVHLDIKPENILVTSDWKVMLIDFGTAQINGQNPSASQGTTIGTCGYMAPEGWRNNNYSNKTDVWACGVILFIMLTGYHPYDKPVLTDRNYKILIEEGPQALMTSLCLSANHYDPKVISLLEGMLDGNPLTRLSAPGALNHHCFSSSVGSKGA